MKPIKLAVEALSRRDANILTSEGILGFLLSSLKDERTELASELLNAIKKRIEERRNIELVSLAQFLQNPNSFKSTNSTANPDSFFTKISKAGVVRTAKDIIMKHFNYVDNSNDDVLNIEEDLILVPDDEPEILSNSEEPGCSLSLENKLQTAMDNCLKKMPPKIDHEKIIVKELNIFELTGELTITLKKLFDSIKSIKPTSTESERVFSIASCFSTKKRSRLSDASLNALCFLKTYFKKH